MRSVHVPILHSPDFPATQCLQVASSERDISSAFMISSEGRKALRDHGWDFSFNTSQARTRPEHSHVPSAQTSSQPRSPGKTSKPYTTAPAVAQVLQVAGSSNQGGDTEILSALGSAKALLDKLSESAQGRDGKVGGTSTGSGECSGGMVTRYSGRGREGAGGSVALVVREDGTAEAKYPVRNLVHLVRFPYLRSISSILLACLHMYMTY